MATTTMTTTWNGAVSHATSRNARVDLFFGTLRGVDKCRLVDLLEESYNENPLHTIKIIAYVRDCRGGKGERAVARMALEWLAEHHAPELVHNLAHFVNKFGRFDDVVPLVGSNVEKDMLELFKNQLEEDLKQMQHAKRETMTGISLCAKWIPSEKKSADKKTRVLRKLARHMKLSPAELRKKYLAPLRSRLVLLESQMCAKQWEEIDFNRVPSCAMRIHGKPQHAFERHLKDKYDAWRGKLSTGESKVNAKVLFPHQVVAECLHEMEASELLEAQWKVLVEEGAKMGNVAGTLVMSDVSGSMSGRPMEVSIALGLLVSELATDDFKHLVMTFETNPQLVNVEAETLFERVKKLQAAPWGGSTDFALAFRCILQIGVQQQLTAEQMPQRLLVISDMQFNQADGNLETNYAVLKKEFEAHGFVVPHLVFWNVNGSTTDFPTHSGQAKVSLVSGFSVGILKAVLKGTEVTPLDTMLAAILDERYDCIGLVDGEGSDEDKDVDMV